MCEDWRLDGLTNRRVSILGLIWTIRSTDDPPFPLFYREFSVFLALTAGRGQGEGQITCVFEDTGVAVFETPTRPIAFPADPLQVLGVSFRVRDVTFQRP